MNILMIDVGGTNVKLMASGHEGRRKVRSGPKLTAAQMAKEVLKATEDWNYKAISLGFPGLVNEGRPAREPLNLGGGWLNFDYEKALGKPLRFLNDAAMQALGGYKHGRMLFLGLGTGMGSAMVIEGSVVPLELAHLPYKKGLTYEDYLGVAGLHRRGKKKWRASVLEVVQLLEAAMICDTVLLGGGNAKFMKDLPSHVVVGSNENAIHGGFRLWEDPMGKKAAKV